MTCMSSYVTYMSSYRSSFHFFRCRNIYPCRIIRPEKGEKVPLHYVYTDLVEECNRLGLHVINFTADAPKRAQLRQILRHNGKHGKYHWHWKIYVIINDIYLYMNHYTLRLWLMPLHHCPISRQSWCNHLPNRPMPRQATTGPRWDGSDHAGFEFEWGGTN